MVGAFSKVLKEFPGSKFIIVGNWSDNAINLVLKGIDKAVIDRIEFIGETNNIEDYLSLASLYIHVSRGDAFPTATIEAMASGIPCIVSKMTGTIEIVKLVSEEFIVNIDEDDLFKSIVNYFKKPLTERVKCSTKFREISKKYSLSQANVKFSDAFKEVLERLNKC